MRFQGADLRFLQARPGPDDAQRTRPDPAQPDQPQSKQIEYHGEKT